MISVEKETDVEITYLNSPAKPVDQLEYIGDMAEELRLMALDIGADTLAHVLSVVAIEAELQRKIRLEFILSELRD